MGAPQSLSWETGGFKRLTPEPIATISLALKFVGIPSSCGSRAVNDLTGARQLVDLEGPRSGRAWRYTSCCPYR